jgi:hypothetical protein
MEEYDSNSPIFDLDRLESVELESGQSLRPAKAARRGKNWNPNQLDLFNQPILRREENKNDGNPSEKHRARADGYETRQHDGIQNPQTLAAARTETGRAVARQADAEDLYDLQRSLEIIERLDPALARLEAWNRLMKPSTPEKEEAADQSAKSF